MIKLTKYFLAIACLSLATSTYAETSVTLNFTSENNTGESVGTILIRETPLGLLITPNLHGLNPGLHGLHVHQNASCDKNGMAAGGHFDPSNTGKHAGPYTDEGHLGDLPILYVNSDGTANTPVLTPRLHYIAEISHHALMIHTGGDNYSDNPEKLGGGGTRMVCGIIN